MKLTSIELIAACPDPVIIVDNQGIISVMNPAAEKLLGFKAEDAINSLRLSDLYEREGEADNVDTYLKSTSYGEVGLIHHYDTRIMGYSGEVFPVQLSAAVLNEGDNPAGIIHYFHDLTAREKLEVELRELSRTDHLTGLSNPRQLDQILQEEIQRSTRYMHPFGLICFSLHGLKEANDQLGYVFGDDLLKLLALVTRDVLRENDTGYRFTGNEFMAICPETDYSGAKRVAKRLESTFSNLLPQALGSSLSELKTPLTLNQGITVFYGGNNVEREELTHQAVQSMNKAKLSNEDQICLFEANMRTNP